MREFSAHLAAHHGVISRREARGVGVSDSMLRRMLERGDLVRTHPSVYRSTSHRPTWSSGARGAALSTGGILSHRSAAAIWNIDGFAPSIIELSIDYRRWVRLVGVKVHYSKQLGLVDATVIDGLEVTGPERTLLDLAAVLSPQRLNLAIDAVIRQKLMTWSDMYDVLTRHSARGRNGCGKLRAMLDARMGETSIPDSAWNRMVGTLLLDAGLPEPVYEHEVNSADGTLLARVDLAYPRKRLAIELDSRRWHLNSHSFEADPRRKNRLLLDGWHVLTFTWADYADTPGSLVSTVRSALAPPKFPS